MCRHIYDWNIVNCDVKQPIQLNNKLKITMNDFCLLANYVVIYFYAPGLKGPLGHLVIGSSIGLSACPYFRPAYK